MRVSQVEIEPVLQRAVQAAPMVEARWGVALEDLSQDAGWRDRDAANGGRRTETSAARYLAGCDGGTSRVRSCLGIQLEGQCARAAALHDAFPLDGHATCCSAGASPGTTSRRRAR